MYEQSSLIGLLHWYGSCPFYTLHFLALHWCSEVNMTYITPACLTRDAVTEQNDVCCEVSQMQRMINQIGGQMDNLELRDKLYVPEFTVLQTFHHFTVFQKH